MKFLEFLINKESQTRDEKYLMKFDGFDVKKSTTEAIKEHQRRRNFTLITQIIFLMQISQIKQMV